MIDRLLRNPLEDLKLAAAGDEGADAAGGAGAEKPAEEPDADALMAQFASSLPEADRAALEGLSAAVEKDEADFTEAEAPPEEPVRKFEISTEVKDAMPVNVSETVTHALSLLDESTQGELILAFDGKGRELATAIEDLDQGLDHDAPTAAEIMKRKAKADRHGLTLAQLSTVTALAQQAGIRFNDALFLVRNVNEFMLDEYGNAAGSEVSGRVNSVRVRDDGRRVVNSTAVDDDTPITATFNLRDIVGAGEHNYRAMVARARELASGDGAARSISIGQLLQVEA